jgi:hypothetical protein
MRIRTFGTTLLLAALALTATGSPAGASVTIGQTHGPPNNACTSFFDRIQPTVTSGNSYVVPLTIAAGTITSWSTEAGGGALTMKVYRPLGGARYLVVGHDGFRDLTPGLNAYSVSIPVKAGDVLGSSTPGDAGMPGCSFTVPGDSYLARDGNLADGQQEDFLTTSTDRRLNISAVVVPSNAFTLGAITRNKKKGTALLAVNAPNPGQLTVSGNGVKSAAAHSAATTVSAPGTVSVLIKAKGKKKAKLNDIGKVKVKPTITYTPTGGDPSAQSTKVKLKKKV